MKNSPKNKEPFLLGNFEALDELRHEDGGAYYKARSVAKITAYFLSKPVAEAWIEDSRTQVQHD